jgi:transcriptional regulator with XRE-family HTH domain
MATNPLKSYREEQGLSQQEVADKLGVSRQMVSFLENGERDFTADMAVLMEKKLGIARGHVRPDLFGRVAA